MAHEAAPEVCHDEVDFAYFYSNPTFADLTILIGNESICAHKVVLTCRSGYFREILLKQVDLKEIALKDVTNSQFKNLLKIIYTGTLGLNFENFDVLCDLIRLAERFKVEFIERELEENFQKLLTIENCCNIFNCIVLSKFEKTLKGKVLQFMNANATQIIESDHFITLSHCAAASFLSQDELCLEETIILEAIEKWRKHNTDPDDLVAKCLRLSRFTKKELLGLRRCDVVDKIRLLEVLDELENNTLTVRKRSEDIADKWRSNKKVWDQNIADKELGAKMTADPLGCKLFSNQSWSVQLNAIKIELPLIYAFNHIKFRLGDMGRSYYIEISNDNQKWSKIIDYTPFKCRSFQNLYFDEVSAKYIRFIGDKDFDTSSIEIMLKKETPQYENGIIRPTENVACPTKGAIVLNKDYPNNLLNGNTTFAKGFVTLVGNFQKNYIIIQLAQPYLISSCKLLLFDDYQYRYFIETSVNQKDWQLVVDRRNENCSGWQNLQFTETPAVFIRITGTYTSEFQLPSNYNKVGILFKCAHFECPSV